MFEFSLSLSIYIYILPDHSLSTTAKLKRLDILPLQGQFLYNTAVLMFNIKSIWVGRLTMYATFLTERLLDMSKKNVLPRTRIDLYKMSFAFSGSSVWNSSSENENVQVCAGLQGRPA